METILLDMLKTVKQKALIIFPLMPLPVHVKTVVIAGFSIPFKGSISFLD